MNNNSKKQIRFFSERLEKKRKKWVELTNDEPRIEKYERTHL